MYSPFHDQSFKTTLHSVSKGLKKGKEAKPSRFLSAQNDAVFHIYHLLHTAADNEELNREYPRWSPPQSP